MAAAQASPPFNKPWPIPKGKDWPALLAKDGDGLETHYHTLEELEQVLRHVEAHLPQGAGT